MKYLRLFEDFSNRQDTKELTMYEFINLFNENCKNYDFKSTYKLSRSVNLDNNKLYLINPMLQKRTSISGIPNIYTMIMNNEPMWAKYPKRSYGLVGYMSENPFRAEYVVIPYDGAKIGACLKVDDIWTIWNKRVKKNFDPKYINLSNSGMLDILERILTNDTRPTWDRTFRRFDKHDYEKLKSELKEVEDTIMDNEKRAISATAFVTSQGATFIADIQKHIRKYGGLFEFLKTLYSPVKDFKVGDINMFNTLSKKTLMGDSTPGIEVWTNSECLLISAKLFEEFKSELKIRKIHNL